MSSQEAQTKILNNSADEREMKKYGVERVPVYYFHYREFRYTNVEDAIAQAKRYAISQGKKSPS